MCVKMVWSDDSAHIHTHRHRGSHSPHRTAHKEDNTRTVAMPMASLRVDFILDFVVGFVCWNHSLNSNKFQISFVRARPSSLTADHEFVSACVCVCVFGHITFHAAETAISSKSLDVSCFRFGTSVISLAYRARIECALSIRYTPIQSYHPLTYTWNAWRSLFSSKSNRVQTTSTTINK